MLGSKKKRRHPDDYRILGRHSSNLAQSSESFQIADNRSGTAQLQRMQDALQLANRNSRRRKNAKSQKEQEKITIGGSDRRVAEHGGNWEILEVGDYLKRHKLKLHSINAAAGKTVMSLTDGSIILIDVNQYWRHESAEQENAYFDASHAINGDNVTTHFWTKKGYSLYSEN